MKSRPIEIITGKMKSYT